MKTRFLLFILTTFTVFGCLVIFTARGAKTAAANIMFSGTEYFHRWTKDDQHEFTPQGQENLEHWSEMITVNYYRGVKDGEGLSENANTVMENYKSHHAVILKTDSVPRTPEKPAEHFVTALFPRPDFVEVVFTRFKIINGIGSAVTCSHRQYGKDAGNVMNAWLEKNGEPTEKALLGLDNLPGPDAYKK